MSFLAHIIVAIAIAIGSPTSSAPEQPVKAPTAAENIQDEESLRKDAWKSYKARAACPNATSAVYVDSGEHGTTQTGQTSVWSVSNPDVFHHFICR